MTQKKDYWQNFYRNNRQPDQPSSFATHVHDQYLKAGQRLLELGSGNGRDSLFFAKKGLSTVGLEYDKEQVAYLNRMQEKNVIFESRDFSCLKDYSNFNYVYSRFAFHAITEQDENRVLDQLMDVLISGGIFMMEARSTKDKNLPKVFGMNHYRRYIDLKLFCDKVVNRGLCVIDAVETQGVAVYKNEDPWIVRVIAKKE